MESPLTCLDKCDLSELVDVQSEFGAFDQPYEEVRTMIESSQGERVSLIRETSTVAAWEFEDASLDSNAYGH